MLRCVVCGYHTAYPEDEDITIIRNVGKYSPKDTVSYLTEANLELLVVH